MRYRSPDPKDSLLGSGFPPRLHAVPLYIHVGGVHGSSIFKFSSWPSWLRPTNSGCPRRCGAPWNLRVACLPDNRSPTPLPAELDGDGAPARVGARSRGPVNAHLASPTCFAHNPAGSGWAPSDPGMKQIAPASPMPPPTDDGGAPDRLTHVAPSSAYAPQALTCHGGGGASGRSVPHAPVPPPPPLTTTGGGGVPGQPAVVR